jgi:hypothetical protein
LQQTRLSINRRKQNQTAREGESEAPRRRTAHTQTRHARRTRPHAVTCSTPLRSAAVQPVQVHLARRKGRGARAQRKPRPRPRPRPGRGGGGGGGGGGERERERGRGRDRRGAARRPAPAARARGAGDGGGGRAAPARRPGSGALGPLRRQRPPPAQVRRTNESLLSPLPLAPSLVTPLAPRALARVLGAPSSSPVIPTPVPPPRVDLLAAGVCHRIANLLASLPACFFVCLSIDWLICRACLVHLPKQNRPRRSSACFSAWHRNSVHDPLFPSRIGVLLRSTFCRSDMVERRSRPCAVEMERSRDSIL